MSFQRKIFLAANSPSGFVSFFDELYNPYRNCRAYIIKGGPGTGKSSFMKKIAAAAEEKGHEVTRVFCSSDPQSLDGVMIPSLSVCVADGTAPHVLEPRFPGAVENIVNLGEFWNEKELFQKSDEIRSLSLENSIFHRRSSRFLSAAGALFQENERLLAPYVLEDKLSGFAARFCARETPKKKHAAPGKKSVCLLSGITPQGIVFFDETVKACASRVIGVEDEYGCVSGRLLEQIGACAVKNGYNVIFCRCPMKPKEDCEHLIIPEVSLALVTLKSLHGIELSVARTVHARRFLKDGAVLRSRRLLLNRNLAAELTENAIEMLAKAKAVHDELEKLYTESMDFKKLNNFTEEFIFSLLAE